MSNIEIIDARHGRMMVNKLDRYVGRSFLEYGEFSEGEVEVFRQMITPDSIVVDVGANIGAHTVVFSKLAKEVYAFEAQRHIFHLLCANVALNELRNVHCYNVAVGDGDDVPYADIDMGHVNNMGAGALLEISQPSTSIPTLKLDMPCHFLKIDVEGMELHVLKGAAEMIRKYQPAIYVENDRPEKSPELIRTLQSFGYRCYWHGSSLFNEDNFAGNPENVFPGIGSINMLCLPKEATVLGLPEADPEVDWHKLWSDNSEPELIAA